MFCLEPHFGCKGYWIQRKIGSLYAVAKIGELWVFLNALETKEFHIEVHRPLILSSPRAVLYPMSSNKLHDSLHRHICYRYKLLFSSMIDSFPDNRSVFSYAESNGYILV